MSTLLHQRLQNGYLNPPQNSSEAKRRWSRFAHKADVNMELKFEQYSLCGYSELSPDLEGIQAHIEHIAPKSQFPYQTFDYTNLIYCALSSEDLQNIDKQLVFGGHAKEDDYSSTKFISCTRPDCFNYFFYLSNGKVIPTPRMTEIEKDSAQYTIDLLNLNSQYLKNRRKKRLKEIDKLIDRYQNDPSLVEVATAYEIVPDNDNKLKPFPSAVRQKLGQIAEKVLSENYSTHL